MSQIKKLTLSLTDADGENKYHASVAVAFVMLMANIAGIIVVWVARVHLPLGVEWAMMCLASGALVGFLFGVPRTNVPTSSDASSKFKYRANLGLAHKDNCGGGSCGVQEHQSFETRVHISGQFACVKSNRRGQEQGILHSLALGLIVYFGVAGVIQGYLLTRMYLSEEFAMSENY